MILLNKKRILFISSIIICSIFSCSFVSQEFSKFTPVSSTPVTNHVVILDAGHGNPDGGATNSNGEIIESDLNLQIVLKLQNLLESSNCTVILTRSDENGIYETDATSIREKKISDMKNRVKIANNSDAEFFISIHMNKLNQTQYSGWQTFYKPDNECSKLLAQKIQTNLNSFMKIENTRQIKPISGIYLSKNVEIPLVIVECGFLSNYEESNLLKTDNYQNCLAWSIYNGIMDYFKEH